MQTAKVVKKIEKNKLTPISPSENKVSKVFLLYPEVQYDSL